MSKRAQLLRCIYKKLHKMPDFSRHPYHYSTYEIEALFSPVFTPTAFNVERLLRRSYNIRVNVARVSEFEHHILLYCHRKHVKRIKRFEYYWTPLGVTVYYKATSHEELKRNEIHYKVMGSA